MTALEARLAVACGSPATPQVVAELEWLEKELEVLDEQQQQPESEAVVAEETEVTAVVAAEVTAGKEKEVTAAGG